MFVTQPLTFLAQINDIPKTNWDRDRLLIDVFTLVSSSTSVGHLLPIRSATDRDGEDEELLYALDKTLKIPFELVSFGSNQIGKDYSDD